MFHDANPGHLRISVGDVRDDLRVKEALEPGSRFCRDMPLVNRLMGEPRVTRDIADREKMRKIRPHLPIDCNETFASHLTPIFSKPRFALLGTLPADCRIKSYVRRPGFELSIWTDTPLLSAVALTICPPHCARAEH